ncbi:MAG: RidA family protein [Chloroflexota bacterium]
MNRKSIRTQDAPAAVGPYSQAIVSGDFVFVSGQLGLDPATGNLKETLEDQTAQALQNLSTILAAAQCSMASVVKTTIFLTDMNDFSTVNGIYAQSFGDEPPARSTVQVAALPLNGLVEIEVIARINL